MHGGAGGGKFGERLPLKVYSRAAKASRMASLTERYTGSSLASVTYERDKGAACRADSGITRSAKSGDRPHRAEVDQLEVPRGALLEETEPPDRLLPLDELRRATFPFAHGLFIGRPRTQPCGSGNTRPNWVDVTSSSATGAATETEPPTVTNRLVGNRQTNDAANERRTVTPFGRG